MNITRKSGAFFSLCRAASARDRCANCVATRETKQQHNEEPNQHRHKSGLQCPDNRTPSTDTSPRAWGPKQDGACEELGRRPSHPVEIEPRAVLGRHRDRGLTLRPAEVTASVPATSKTNLGQAAVAICL